MQPLSLLKQSLAIRPASLGQLLTSSLSTSDFDISYTGNPDNPKVPVIAHVKYVSNQTEFKSFKFELLAIINLVRQNGISNINITAHGPRYTFVYDDLQSMPDDDPVFNLALSSLNSISSMGRTFTTEVSTTAKRYDTGKRKMDIRTTILYGDQTNSATLLGVTEKSLQYFADPAQFKDVTYTIAIVPHGANEQEYRITLDTAESIARYSTFSQ